VEQMKEQGGADHTFVQVVFYQLTKLL